MAEILDGLFRKAEQTSNTVAVSDVRDESFRQYGEIASCHAWPLGHDMVHQLVILQLISIDGPATATTAQSATDKSRERGPRQNRMR